jgi:hypothetical protein
MEKAAKRNSHFHKAIIPGWFSFLIALPFCVTHVEAGSWEIGYSFDAPTKNTNGLTWDGRALWHTNDHQPIIYQLSPLDGSILGTIPTSIADQGDLEFGGNFLWVNSENDHYLHKINPSTGKTIDSILIGLPPGTLRRDGTNSIQVEGCTWDGRNVWVDGGSNRIIRVDATTHRQFLYIMPSEMGYLDGMTWAFDHLWVVTNNAVIYELDPCSMGILDSFDAPANVSAGPEGFAFDGENLWFADTQLDKIYKIILKFRIATKQAAHKTNNPEALPKRSACNQGTEITEFEQTPVSVFFDRRNGFTKQGFPGEWTFDIRGRQWTDSDPKIKRIQFELRNESR